MRYLLDTHAFIWTIVNPGYIPTPTRTLIKVSEEVLVSPVSLLEVSIKFALGKLSLRGITPEELWVKAQEVGLLILPLTPEDASSFHKLEILHKDPFDRMLVWLSIRNKVTLISKDRKMNAYEKHGLNLIW